jgi:hypothetical protein
LFGGKTQIFGELPQVFFSKTTGQQTKEKIRVCLAFLSGGLEFLYQPFIGF